MDESTQPTAAPDRRLLRRRAWTLAIVVVLIYIGYIVFNLTWIAG